MSPLATVVATLLAGSLLGAAFLWWGIPLFLQFISWLGIRP